MTETPKIHTQSDSPPNRGSHTLRQPPNVVANHSFDSDGLALAKRVLKYFGDGSIDPKLDGDIELREMARKIVFDVPRFPCSEVSTGNKDSHTPRPAANLSLANHCSLELDRCAICAWPLAVDIEKGCIRGNCSQRPFPNKFYDYDRACKEYGSTFNPIHKAQPSSSPQPSHTSRPAANLSLANHSPEPWYLFSGQTPGIVFEVRSVDCEFEGEIVALIPCDDAPIPIIDFANAALIAAAPRLLRTFRQLFATFFLVPMEFREVPEQVEAVKAASELLHDLQRAGVF